MANSPIFFSLDAQQIPFDIQETAYYLGYKKNQLIDETTKKMILTASQKMQKILTPKSVYIQYDLSTKENIEFADVSFYSDDLKRNLKESKRIILFAATIGTQVDALIKKSQIISNAEGAIMNACGSMFIEKFVDILNEKIKTDSKQQGFNCRPRFSAGYGDVNLSLQKDFFRLLPCSKISLSLMETLIMSPEKSVTAFIGLEKS